MVDGARIFISFFCLISMLYCPKSRSGSSFGHCSRFLQIRDAHHSPNQQYQIQCVL